LAQNNTASKLVLKGTTTIGVVCKDGVILASDTRVTMGYYVAHKFGKKVYKIDDHLGMTIAGTVADAQRVVDILTANAKLYKIKMNRPMPVSSAARLIANLLFSVRYVLFRSVRELDRGEIRLNGVWFPNSLWCTGRQVPRGHAC
jgi:proteasome beta subunit